MNRPVVFDGGSAQCSVRVDYIGETDELQHGQVGGGIGIGVAFTEVVVFAGREA